MGCVPRVRTNLCSVTGTGEKVGGRGALSQAASRSLAWRLFRSVCYVETTIYRVSTFFGCQFPQQPCHVREIFVFLRAETKHIKIMTAMELNAQIWRDIAEIADSELLMKQLAKYLKKLTAKKHDPTLMTKEEFFAKIEKAEQQIAAGEGMAMLPDEDLSAFLKRNGYGL